MNTNFFINGRCYKTPCKTVLNAGEFTVMFLTCKHTIIANVSDNCYFVSIDNISLADIKSVFQFKRDYTNPKDFLSRLYETLAIFLNTYVPFMENGNILKSTDCVIDRLLEIVSEPTTKSETSETEDTSEKELEKLEKELTELEDTHIDDIKKYKEKAVLNSSYGEASEPVTAYQFERLTGTLFKSLFKAIGLEKTRKIPFIISNNMVFFNYKGTQYKYYPSQCKIFKKSGRKYQRINWKDFAEENNPVGQKQNSGRSPPHFTSDIRSAMINNF